MYPSPGPDAPSTLLDVLRWRAHHHPDKLAYLYLLDGETEGARLTYGDLDRQARAIGALLQGQGMAAAGARALLLYPAGLDFITAFFGCLYAGVIAVPGYPPRLGRPHPTLSRLRAIAHDAQPVAVLATSSILSTVEGSLAGFPDLQALPWLATDDIGGNLADGWHDPGVSGRDLAYLQYTSGSTATPKGVMVTHHNLMHNLAMIQQAFGHTDRSTMVSWLPLFHDMGLIMKALQACFVGAPCILMSPMAFVQKPLRWLQAISRYQAHTSGAPNFAYELCVQKVPPEERRNLDLSSWCVAFNGAEPVHFATLDRFAAAFASCGFRAEALFPAYGLAEATVFVAGGAKASLPGTLWVDTRALEHHRIVPVTPIERGSEQDEGRTAAAITSCGHTWLDQAIVIVDPDTLIRCPPDRVGEIWVSGPSVARGYWNRPDETARTFQAHVADTGEGPFLRTGDLGVVRGGELYVTGRLKDLIIIRGENHYPQDIELTVARSYPGLRPGAGAAFAIERDGEERLVVVQEVERHYRRPDVEAAIWAIQQAVVERHDVPAYAVVLIKTGSIPKTSSGKIQRHLCRAKYLDGSLAVIGSNLRDDVGSVQSKEALTRQALLAADVDARQQLLELYLREQIARLLRVAPLRLDPHQPLSTLGLDSLMAVELKNGIETNLRVVLPMVSFLQSASISHLASDVLCALDDCSLEPAAVPSCVEDVRVEYPLSLNQRSLWFLHQWAPESAAYNIATAFRIRSEIDIPALRRAFQTLLDRHPSLRTTFTSRHGEPMQQVHEHVDVSFAVEHVSGWSESSLHARLAAEGNRPFDLEHGPLMRVQLFRRSAHDYALLLAIHHIVADLWSLSVIMRELDVLYTAEQAGIRATLPAQAHQYADYVRRQADMLRSPEGERLWAYWHRQLAGAVPVLDLPTDRPRPAIQSYGGAMLRARFDAALTQKVKLLGASQGVTLYTLFLAAFQVLLFHYSGQEDIVVGSPTAGRNRADLAGLVGYFVNPVVLRANLAGNPSFAAFLRHVRHVVLGMLAHSDYPFATLVERLRPERAPGRPPLVQVMFVWQEAYPLRSRGFTGVALSESGAYVDVGGLRFESMALDRRIAQFDLTLEMAELDGHVAAALEYNTDLFDEATIARLLAHFHTLLENIVARPEQRLLDLLQVAGTAL